MIKIPVMMNMTAIRIYESRNIQDRAFIDQKISKNLVTPSSQEV